MTPPLFLLEGLPVSPGVGDEFELGGEEGWHAARVRRLRAGESVLVADGDGLLLACKVIGSAAGGLTLRVLDVRRVPEQRPRFVVVQALAKGERGELAVELLTELGVDEIVPWQALRSVVRWDDPDRAGKALGRWRRTAREAAKQSRRARVPRIGEPRDAAEVIAAAGGGFVLHEDATTPLAEAMLPDGVDLVGDGGDLVHDVGRGVGGGGVGGGGVDRGGVLDLNNLVVVVGPEGGIAPEELASCAAAGATPVRLGAPERGDPVLRTSTAGAAALAVLSARTGRWR